jgi:hypothetical protein
LPCPDASASVSQLYARKGRLKRLARRAAGFRHVSAATDSDHESVTRAQATATGVSGSPEFGHVGAGVTVYRTVYNAVPPSGIAGQAGDAAAAPECRDCPFLT